MTIPFEFDQYLDARGEKQLPGYSYKLQEGGYGLDVQFDELGIDEKEMSAVFPFSDGRRRDGVGDLLNVAGIDVQRHRVNPICLFDHAKTVPLPIGKAEDPNTREYTVRIDPANQVATCKAFFYQGGSNYEHALFCEQLFDLVAKKFIRGGSIGYQVKSAQQIPPDYQQGIPQGLLLNSVLLLEASIVVLPANMDTVRKALAMPKICGKAPSPYLIKSLAPYAPARKSQPGHSGVGSRVSTGAITTDPRATQEQGRVTRDLTPGHRGSSGGVDVNLEDGGLAIRMDRDVSEVAPNQQDRRKAIQTKATYSIDPKRPARGDRETRAYNEHGELEEVIHSPSRQHQEDQVAREATALRKEGHKVEVADKGEKAQELTPEQVKQEIDRERAATLSQARYDHSTDRRERMGGPIRKVFYGSGDVKPGKAPKIDRSRYVDEGEKAIEDLSRDVRKIRNRAHDRMMEEHQFANNAHPPHGTYPSYQSEQHENQMKPHNELMRTGPRADREVEKAEEHHVGEYLLHGKSTKLPQAHKTKLPPARWKPGLGAEAEKELRLKYRSVKGLRRKLKKSSSGKAVVYLHQKDIEEAKKSATDRGISFSQLGHRSGLEKVRLSGDDGVIDDLARRFGRRVKSLEGAMGTKAQGNHRVISPRTVHQTGARLTSVRDGYGNAIAYNAEPHEDRTSQQNYVDEQRELAQGSGHTVEVADKGDKAMATETEVDEHEATEPEQPYGGEETPVEEEDEGMEVEQVEKYSLQCLRQMHENARILLEQYHEMVGPMEQEKVKGHIEKKLESLVSDLEDLESLCEEIHPGSKLGEDSKSMDEDEEEEPEYLDEEQTEEAEEELGEDPEEAEEEEEEELAQEEGEEEEESDTDAIPADSRMEEEPTEEEVVEGMRKDPRRGMGEKRLPPARTKGLSLCPTCGKKGCLGHKAMPSDKISPSKAKVVLKDDEVHGHKLTDKQRRMFGAAAGKGKKDLPGEDLDDKDKHKAMDDESNGLAPPPPPPQTPAATTPGGLVHRGDFIQLKSMDPLAEHERHHVGEAADFLSLLGNASELTDEDRMKSYHFHKMMDCIGNVGTKDDDLSRAPELPTDVGGRAGYHRPGGSHPVIVDGEVRHMTDEDLDTYFNDEITSRTPNTEVGEANPGPMVRKKKKKRRSGEVAKKDMEGDNVGQKGKYQPPNHHQQSLNELDEAHSDQLDARGTSGSDDAARRTDEATERVRSVYRTPNVTSRNLLGYANQHQVDREGSMAEVRRRMGGKDMDEGNGMVEGDEGEKSFHPHRQSCLQASPFFKALSTERAFGDRHREEALFHHSILSPIAHGEEEENTEESEGEEGISDLEGAEETAMVGDVDTKALSEDLLSQAKLLEELNQRLQTLNS